MLVHDSFANTHPDLVSQWDEHKNDVTPYDVSARSGRIVWWLCENNHSYQKSVAEKGRYPKCPACMMVSRGKVERGVNDLETTHPEIASQWDNERNVAFTYDVTAKSRTKVFWLGHKEPIYVPQFIKDNLVPGGQTHLTPSGALLTTPVETAIATTHPQWASWFADDSPYAPHEVTKWSVVVAKFSCPKGHEWEEKTRHFFRRNDDTKCPVCSGRLLVPGVNDLATTHPDIASTLLDTSLGSQVTCVSHAVLTWKCTSTTTKSHTFDMDVSKRVNEVKCPVCINMVIVPGVNDLATVRPHIFKQWADTNVLDPSKITYGTEQTVHLICEKCSKVYSTHLYVASRTRSVVCSSCQSSRGEQELNKYISSLDVDVVRNSRKIISPQEVDIFIPEQKLGFEFNGVYWHSDAIMDKNYHKNKWDAAEKAGIQLIAVWEDDWKYKNDVVKSMISHKLGLNHNTLNNSTGRVGARMCTINTVPPHDAKVFLDSNHIQGGVNGCKHVGLVFDGALVAIMSYSVCDSNIVINRYATSCIVPGGFTKLLTNVVSTCVSLNLPVATVVSFVDRMVSNGSLYKQHGFTVDTMIPPDYHYLVNDRRVHKFNYRKKRFATDDKLLFKNGLTESQLADLNNIPKVYDAGKYRMVAPVTTWLH